MIINPDAPSPDYYAPDPYADPYAPAPAPAPTDTSTVGGPEPPPYNPSPSAPSTNNTGITPYSAPTGFSGNYSGFSSPAPSPTSPLGSVSPALAPGAPAPIGPANGTIFAPRTVTGGDSSGGSAAQQALNPAVGRVTSVTASGAPPPNPSLPPYRQVEGQWDRWLGAGGAGVTPGPRPDLYRPPQDLDPRQYINRFNAEGLAGIGGQYARFLGGPQSNFADFGEGRGPVNIRTGQGYLWYDQGRRRNPVANAGATTAPSGGFAGQGAAGGLQAVGAMGGGGAYQPSNTFGAAGITREAVADQYRKQLLAAMAEGNAY